MKKLLIGLSTFGLLALPLATFAVAEPALNNEGGIDKAAFAGTGLAQGSLPDFISTIIRWVLGIIGVLLVALFVYGGVLYATSAGNEDRVETGKRVMIYAIIGTVIVFAAFVISDYVISALISTNSGA